MSEREPSLEEKIAALRQAIQNMDQEPESQDLPGKQAFILSRDAMELIPNRPAHLLNDMMTQWRELEQLWKLAQTPEEKNALKDRIKRGLERTLLVLERKP